MVSLKQRLRKHEVTHADRRRDRLGKRPDIDHTFLIIIALQRRNRFSFITKFTVVIIFNDITCSSLQAIVLGPSQKFHAPFDRHHDPQRVLMGRHDKRNIRSGRFQLSDVHTFRIHIYCTNIIRKLFKKTVGLHISRIFQRNFMLSPDHHRQQHQQIIISRSDNDLFRRTIDASRLMQIITDRTAQSLFSLRIPEAEQFRPVVLQTFL